MLEVNGLSAGYGSTQVLQDVSLHVAPGDSVCLIGANGAGKTTLLRCIAGLLPARAGRISVSGRDVGTASASARLGLGMALVPEGRRVFAPMSVRENLEMGAFRRLWPRRDPAVAADMTMVFDLFPRLWERRSLAAGLLSGGEQQMLAVGRGLMLKPRLLMLDEPSLGLAPVMTDVTFEKIGEIHKMGTAILLVEQNVSRALSLVQRAYVLESGNVIMHGTSTELANNKQVQAAYLGI